jgi:ABC-type multidrug transport system fused ATPase/permease subunit
VGVAGLLGFRLLSSLVRSFLLLYLRTRLDARLALEFLEHLVGLPYLFFQQRSAGDLAMRLNSNSTIRELLTSSALSTVLDGSMVSLYLLFLFFASPKMGLLAAALGVIRVLVFLFVRMRQRDLMSRSLQVQAKSRSYEFELLAGIETVKAAGAEGQSVQHWSNLFVAELNASLDRGRLDAMVNSLLDLLTTASPLVILLYGSLLVIHGELSLGSMLALNALALGFLTPLSTLVTTASQLQIMGSYLDRINDVFDTPKEQEGEGLRPAAPLSGRIVLEEVTFRYALPSSAPRARASRPWRRSSPASPARRRGASSTTASTSPTWTSNGCAASSASSPSSRTSSAPPSAPTSPSPSPTCRSPASSKRRSSPASTTTSWPCPCATTASSPTTAPRSPVASASVSPWRAPWSAGPGSSSSTKPPAPSTPSPRKPCRRTSPICARRASSSPTA